MEIGLGLGFKVFYKQLFMLISIDYLLFQLRC